MIKTKGEKRQDIVKKIKALRKRGATYDEITFHFNDIGVRTMMGGSWSIQSLHRFLKMHK